MDDMNTDEKRRADMDEEPIEEGDEADLAGSTLIGANITGINAGTFPGGIIAGAADAAAKDAAAERAEGVNYNDDVSSSNADEQGGLEPMNLDALPQATNDEQHDDS